MHTVEKYLLVSERIHITPNELSQVQTMLEAALRSVPSTKLNYGYFFYVQALQRLIRKTNSRLNSRAYLFAKHEHALIPNKFPLYDMAMLASIVKHDRQLLRLYGNLTEVLSRYPEIQF